MPPWDALADAFRAKGSVLVAYSGGVDSAVLAKVGADVLGERSLALVVDGESYAQSERDAAEALARAAGFRVEVVAHAELADQDYRANPPDRCYFCRRGLADVALGVARARGFAAVAVGTNVDDLGEWRPGHRAIREAGLWEPFLELGWTKADVRAAARGLGLPAWDKPSMACLSSRIPYGEEITVGKLRRVEAAEEAVRALGFRQVRVRSHGERARVEVEPEAVARALARAADVRDAVLAAGFAEAEVDPRGYRAGGLAEALRVRAG